MEGDEVFLVNRGLGETSYAETSTPQAMDVVNHITKRTVMDLYLSETPQCLKIADLGCSSVPNTLSLVKEILHEIDESCHAGFHQVPEVHVFLNGLSANDFNTMFIDSPNYIHALSKDGKRDISSSVFIAGVPGSFYGRLFPSKSLHFIYSSYCLHWLSQVPPGIFEENGEPMEKGKIYISNESPPLLLKAYLDQFQRDFFLFLKSRSAELTTGGRMVIIMTGRRTNDHSDESITFLWDILAEAFAIMVSKGKIEKQKFDSYKTHYYAPSMVEIEAEVKKEGSFAIDRSEMFEGGHENIRRDAITITNAVRAIQEPMILHHFGKGVAETLFRIFSELLAKTMGQKHVHAAGIILVLRKLV